MVRLLLVSTHSCSLTTGVDEEMLKFSVVVPSEKMNEGTEWLTIGHWGHCVICRAQNLPHLDHRNLILTITLALTLSPQVCRAMTLSRLKFCLCQIGVASVLAPLKSRPIVPFSLIDD